VFCGARYGHIPSSYFKSKIGKLPSGVVPDQQYLHLLGQPCISRQAVIFSNFISQTPHWKLTKTYYQMLTVSEKKLLCRWYQSM